LFGHKKGSFTGADTAHVGFFERAHGGSLFLDEVADASSRVQAMLLRVLETSKVLPLGASLERTVDVRLVAATERDVAAEAMQGLFRGSLAQRLSGFVIRVPALRERREDIPSLLLHFLSTLDSARSGPWLSPARPNERTRLPTDFMFQLVSHKFPGNVRELRNIAMLMLARGRIPDRSISELAAPWTDSRSGGARPTEPAPAPGSPVPSARPCPSKQALLEALVQSRWSPARAARLLGVPNSTLHYWIKQKGIVRRAIDYSNLELKAVAERLGGDVDAMADDLAVSKRGLRLRLQRAQIDSSSS
jgi:DNA-binding NtrC family response regulator